MFDESRIPTGIAGLDRVIEGGIRNNTTLLVVGSSGTGKSTFAMQYLMYGLEHGENALYMSLEEPPEQIMREAAMLGFDMEKYHNKELFFFHSKGDDFKLLVEEQLPALVEAKQDYSVKTRVVIDPLTPLIWSVHEKQEQRDLITKLFYTLKQLGPVLITTEEHAAPGEALGEDVLIPIYMSDGAVHLTYRPIGGAFNRSLEIIKMRATRHGEEVYPYIFVRGLGVVVRTSPMMSAEDARKYDDTFDKAIKTAADLGASDLLLDKIRYIKENWSYTFSPKETLEILFESQGLTGALKKADIAKKAEEAEIEQSSEQSPDEMPADSDVVMEEVPIMAEEVPLETVDATVPADDAGASDDGTLIDVDDISELEDLIL